MQVASVTQGKPAPGHPRGRRTTLGEDAGAAYLLCSPESDYITGEVLVCAGGHSF
ncbi:hypothetical protein CS0771_53900 [Catellatospora sp. IY07-71]|nr:hypothetical protein CS0771_53900 [Catellatospora sp. IY07-71]